MNTNSTIKAAIFGGSGYGGSELIRILLMHPAAEIALVTANEHAGKPVAAVHRNLLGLIDLSFGTIPEDLSAINDIDVIFFALPHGQALSLAPQIPSDIKIIDLSGDFRLSDAATHTEFYKQPHAGDFQRSFVYGLTEVNREAIRSAERVSNPGCFATATSLALAPFVRQGLISGIVIVDAKTGSSGSGAKAAANTHHPQRSNSFYAYKPFSHQHLPEIEEHLSAIGSIGDRLFFMTHSLPVSRGIFASCYFEIDREMTAKDLEAIVLEHYRDSFFVRLVEGSPDINWVKNTNFCDISVHVKGKHVVVFSAIDNLVKGAAGQAVQNMNLMFGLDETTGLRFTGANP
jgi:N-acetyl-gamma-glutamyl-phosphate reductase common form